jgi:uncharacterized protein YecE (DUF72 family)
MSRDAVLVGTAGWAIPRQNATSFPGLDSHLARYAKHFSVAEINSSFHRPHRSSTYERWAAAVPDGFRFSVKMPKAVTHQKRLADVADLVHEFFDSVRVLGPKLGPALAQLPPSLAFDATLASVFIDDVRRCFAGPLVCEPRHASWFGAEADGLLAERGVARAAADPAVVPAAAQPGGWTGLVYYRLHGSPRRYYSSYAPDRIEHFAATLLFDAPAAAARWCIFDNTAGQSATSNALAFVDELQSRDLCHRDGSPQS